MKEQSDFRERRTSTLTLTRALEDFLFAQYTRVTLRSHYHDAPYILHDAMNLLFHAFRICSQVEKLINRG